MTHYPVYRGVRSVSLGVMQKEYLEQMLSFANDASVVRGVLLRPPVTLQSEEVWYERVSKQNADHALFAVLLHGSTPNTYQYIGHTDIGRIRHPEGIGVSGSLLGGREYLGHGYGTEAKLLLLFHAFHVLGLRKVNSTVKAINPRSCGHLMKCGYKVVGRRRKECWDPQTGMLVDEILLEVFREEWEPLWSAYQERSELPALSEEQKQFLAREFTHS